ncbi:MAG TPA: class I SAM-dependent methyltransferase [Candidatus Acidoferrales bacterium]|nr:class I SAM-dependent methyltransferase [Candidatus Acidoferrales bacterium]
MEAQALRALSETQVATFDHDYVSDESFELVASLIERDFSGRAFTFLDVGAGKGIFTDRILNRYPLSNGVALDTAETLLAQNSEHPRKQLSLVSATEAARHFASASFDLVFFNFSLHHFVGDTYRRSRLFQHQAVVQAKKLLAPSGRISVLENAYEGALHHNLPGYLTYTLSRSETLAPLVRRLGANTAGCGVCFLSTTAWRKEFARAGLREASYRTRPVVVRSWSHNLKLRSLTLRGVNHAHFWLSLP